MNENMNTAVDVEPVSTSRQELLGYSSTSYWHSGLAFGWLTFFTACEDCVCMWQSRTRGIVRGAMEAAAVKAVPEVARR